MNNKDDSKASRPLKKSKQKEQDEFIDVFKYFESANMRNRDAFCELLDYSMENIKDPHK